MIYRNLFLIYILLFINICKIYSVELRVLFYSYGGDDPKLFHRQIEGGFIEYTKKNNLDIQINYNVLTPWTSTINVQDYSSMVEQIIKGKSNKYDVFFYYGAYTRKYANYFEDITKYVSKEIIEQYDENLLRETCSSDDNELVALPIFLSISTLFSRRDLLIKYNKRPPRTWDELMETSKIIAEGEKKQNKTELKRYNGCVNDYNGSLSIYEFINSYRDSNKEEFPKLTDIKTIAALERIKEMKDEIGEDIFRASDESVIFNIFMNETTNHEYIFARYFYSPHNKEYVGTALPGEKEGVSGSIVIPNNFAINKFVNDEKKKAAGEFLNYIFSKSSQKQYVIGNQLFSGILDIYKEPGVCKSNYTDTNEKLLDCDIINGSQPFSFLSNYKHLFANDNYHQQYRKKMFEYIYGDKPLNEVLKAVSNLSSGVSRSMGNISFLLTITLMLCWLLF